MWNTISSGKVWYGDIKNKAKDLSFYWVRTTIVPIFDDDGKIKQYIAVRTDITSQIELAEKVVKSEKLSVIGQLSSRLAHDIRNPLSIIKISLENLKIMYGLDDAQTKQFRKIDRSINRITHQIDDVLDYVKNKPVNGKKTSILELIQETLNSLKISENTRVVIPKNDVVVVCDAHRLSIALNNLLFNSIQAIGQENGLIAIGLEEEENSIRIEIEDSGKGISKKDIKNIFEPLFTTKQHGTGLGLASVKSIVEVHGGTVSVSSPPTVFTIILPKHQNSVENKLE